jgi:hemerythrin-like domain-containing protein
MKASFDYNTRDAVVVFDMILTLMSKPMLLQDEAVKDLVAALKEVAEGYDHSNEDNHYTEFIEAVIKFIEKDRE